MKEPITPEEWQEAVNAADQCLKLDACFQYGLVQRVPLDEKGKQRPGRPSKKSGIDVARCLDIMARGAEKGIKPQE